MTDWKLGQYVRVWKNEGYEYGHIETIENPLGFIHLLLCSGCAPAEEAEVMLVGDDGKEIYTTVKELEEG